MTLESSGPRKKKLPCVRKLAASRPTTSHSHGKAVALLVYQTRTFGILISDVVYIDVLAVTISVASAAIGFLCGSSARRERMSRGQVVPPPAVPDSKERDGHDSGDDEDSAADGDLSTVSAGLLQPCKLVRLYDAFTSIDTNYIHDSRFWW